MNKEKALERLDAIESEAKELREIIKAPEKRKPEAGDVYSSNYASWLVSQGGSWTDLSEGYFKRHGMRGWDDAGHTYKGKFHEVYVKISDVRAALEVATKFGLNALNYLESGASGNMCLTSKDKTLEALRKLNII
tara:strand:+ start:156 stop:560 length:405 start_codon:yes stop_codon:yes gene_type:complete